MRDFEGFRLQTVADDPALFAPMQALIERVWPKFVTESHHPKGHSMPFDWFGVFRRWPHLQFVLLESKCGEIAAVCNALTLAWDGALESLPDEGWNWAMYQAVLDLEAGRRPTLACALSITLDPAQQGKGLSSVAVRAMKMLVQETGVSRFVAPVRPITKALYPITPMDKFCRWQNGEGLPLDPWMRVHARLGARVIKACNRSQPFAGTVAEWEKWLNLSLPASGDYVGPGLLSPLHVNCEADEAVNWEPNLWMEHPLT